MSFTVEHGDLFDHPAEALAHGVNCQGVTGGLAAVMADRFPDAMMQYGMIALSRLLRPGEAMLTRDAQKGRAILHCASQDLPGPNATPAWLRQSLTEALEIAHREGISSVAVPLIGGGIGGIQSEVAHTIIEEAAVASPVAVTLVLP